jgi:hypothetical protein
MKTDFRSFVNFLIITTCVLAVLIITSSCISMIMDKYHTHSVLQLFLQPIIDIGSINLVIFLPSTIFFAQLKERKKSVEDLRMAEERQMC